MTSLSRPSLEDVLDAFAVEPDPNRETLERYLHDYPEHAAALVDLSRELSRELHDEGPLSSTGRAAIDAAWERHVAAMPNVVNDPFAKLSVSDLRKICEALELPRQPQISITKQIILGTPTTIDETIQIPHEKFKPIRLIINAPCPGFGIIDKLTLGHGYPIGLPGGPEANSNNVCPFGPEDMYAYNAGAMGFTLELPTVKKGDPVTLKGVYTGVFPPGFMEGAKYNLVVMFTE